MLCYARREAGAGPHAHPLSSQAWRPEEIMVASSLVLFGSQLLWYSPRSLPGAASLRGGVISQEEAGSSRQNLEGDAALRPEAEVASHAPAAQGGGPSYGEVVPVATWVAERVRRVRRDGAGRVCRSLRMPRGGHLCNAPPFSSFQG